MPVCANINDAMQKFIGISYETNHQHKEVFKARQITDIKDTLALIRYLKERDPFTQNAFLFNIANGVTALENVDVDSAQDIGNNILKSMVGKSVEDYTFRKVDEAVTLASRSTIKVKRVSVVVNPQLIFQ